MNTRRKIIQRQGNTITIDLPDDFQAETVEVILLPVEEIERPMITDGLTELQRLLLNAPPVTDDEIHSTEEKRRAVNKW